MWKLLNGLMRLVRPEDDQMEDEKPIIQPVTRRGFLLGLGAVAVSQAIPFNRVWSFPSVIRVPGYGYSVAEILALQLERAHPHLPVLYERDPQLFGSGSPNLMRTASGAGLWLREQKAHRVLPLPE